MLATPSAPQHRLTSLSRLLTVSPHRRTSAAVFQVPDQVHLSPQEPNPYAKAEFQLAHLKNGAKVTVGRESDEDNPNFIQMGNDLTSRNHLELVKVNPNEYDLTDGFQGKPSKNGTHVNGQKVAQGEVKRIKAGDFVYLGRQYVWVVGDPEQTRRFNAPYSQRISAMAIGETMTLGRGDNQFHPEAFIILGTNKTSRQHAQLRRTGANTYEIRDIGSRNGTSVNGRQLEAWGEWYPVTAHDTILMGQDFELKLPVAQHAQPIKEPVEQRILNMKKGDALVLGRKRNGAYTPQQFVEIGDANTSREHVELKKMGTNRYRLFDLGSVNGTWVNDKIVKNWTMVKPGDRIRLGDTAPEFVIPEGLESREVEHSMSESIANSIVANPYEDTYFRPLPKSKKEFVQRTRVALNNYAEQFADTHNLPRIILRNLSPRVALAQMTGYMPKGHIIQINPDIVRDNTQKMPEVFAIHEGNHGFRAIIRSLLSPEERLGEVEAQLLDELKKGKSGSVVQIVDGRPELTSLPKNIRRKHRDNLVDLVQTVFQRTPDFVKTSDEGLPILSQEGKAFVHQFVSRTPGFPTATAELVQTTQELVELMIHRRALVLGQIPGQQGVFVSDADVPTLNDEPIKLNEEQKTLAKQFLRETIPAWEANLAAMLCWQNGFQTPKDVMMQYLGCAEEVSSRMAPVNVMLQEIDRIQEQPFLLNRQALMPKLEAERTMLGHQTTVNQLTREWVDVSDALVAEDRPREIGQLQARLRVIESELKLLVPKANMDYMPSDYQ